MFATQNAIQAATFLAIDFLTLFFKLSEALVCFRASGDNFLRSITRATFNKNDGKRKIDF